VRVISCLISWRLGLAVALFTVGPVPVGFMASDFALPPCPTSPNCVSTEATRESQRVPTVPFSDDAASAQRRARAALAAESRTTITVDEPGHLHAECRSLVFRFVDDVDIVVDASARVFRFRSASRVGESDLGVNRRRVERLASRLRQTP
jgi:uncharacterized protein (DUF1499 family)